MKTELEKYISENQLKIDLIDFTTIERSYNHSLRFELGDELENGTSERVKQSVERALKINETCFQNDNEIFVVTYDWGAEGDFKAKTPQFLFETLMVEPPNQKQKLATMYFADEEPELEEGKLGIFKLVKTEMNWRSLLTGIANADMGFTPSIHQIVYFFGLTSKKMFWKYDDRGCLVMSNNITNLETEFETHKGWLCGGYETDYRQKVKAHNKR